MPLLFLQQVVLFAKLMANPLDGQMVAAKEGRLRYYERTPSQVLIWSNFEAVNVQVPRSLANYVFKLARPLLLLFHVTSFHRAGPQSLLASAGTLCGRS
jgi:hypothetical protein